MTLFMFTQWGAYGQFVSVCIAKDIDEAITLLKLKELGWSTTPEFIIEVSDDETTRIVFEGGGDNG